MKYAYNAVYLLLLVVLVPWICWRVIFQNKNRRGWRQKLFGLVPVRNSDRRCVWIHAVSVGEVNLLRPFVDQFRKRYSDFDVAISTTTETGFDLARQRFPDETIFFCPSDFSWAVNNSIRRLRPDLLVLTELELWPNLISVTKEHAVPIALINGRISEKSFNGYRRLGFLVRRFLTKLDVALVQTEEYKVRLNALGMPAEKIEFCGNVKFDCVSPIRPLNGSVQGDRISTQQLVEIAEIADDEFVFLAGSTQENEDRLAIDVYQELRSIHKNLRLILVPRHPDRCDRLETILDELDMLYVRRSQLGSRVPTKDRPVLIVDVIGELGCWWGRANAGYVGGSMGKRGGQNMIEPAGLGVPVCFGPNTENFKDVVELLLRQNAATVVNNRMELKNFIVDILINDVASQHMGERGRHLVASQQGATTRTIDRLACVIRRPEFAAINPTKAA